MRQTTRQAESFANLRRSIGRMGNFNAPVITSPLERLEYMKRHWEEIDRSIRMGGKPADIHLTQLAAHCLVIQASSDE